MKVHPALSLLLAASATLLSGGGLASAQPGNGRPGFGRPGNGDGTGGAAAAGLDDRDPPTCEELTAKLAEIVAFSAYIDAGYAEGDNGFIDRTAANLDRIEAKTQAKADEVCDDGTGRRLQRGKKQQGTGVGGGFGGGRPGNRPPPCPEGEDCPEPPTLEELCETLDDGQEALAYLEAYRDYVPGDKSTADVTIRGLAKQLEILERRCDGDAPPRPTPRPCPEGEDCGPREPPTCEELTAKLAEIVAFAAYIDAGYAEGDNGFIDRTAANLDRIEAKTQAKADEVCDDGTGRRLQRGQGGGIRGGNGNANGGGFGGGRPGNRPPPCPEGEDCPEPPTLEELCETLDDGQEALAYLEAYKDYVPGDKSTADVTIKGLAKQLERLEEKCAE